MNTKAHEEQRLAGAVPGLSCDANSEMIAAVPENANSISELFLNVENIGEATEPNFLGRASSFACGASLRVSLHVDEAQRITEAKFRAAGCSVLVAAASLLTSQAIGQTTASASLLAEDIHALRKQLVDLPADRNECPALASAALVAAIRVYSGNARAAWEGDDALICTCFCVSERTIEHEIRTQGLQTIAAVTAACSAGGGCRSCYPLIQDMLDESSEG